MGGVDGGDTETEAMSALPQVILEMPVTVMIVSHFGGAVQQCHRNSRNSARSRRDERDRAVRPPTAAGSQRGQADLPTRTHGTIRS